MRENRKRLLITAVLLAVSLAAWFFGAGIDRSSEQAAINAYYDDLTENKEDYMEQIERSLEGHDTDLTAEEVYDLECRYWHIQQDGRISMTELVTACRCLKTSYEGNYNLTEMSYGRGGTTDGDLQMLNAVIIVLAAIIAATFAAFAISLLMMIFGKSKRGPILYLVFAVIDFLLAIFLMFVGLSLNDADAGLPVMSIVSLAAAIAAVIAWRVMKPKEETA